MEQLSCTGRFVRPFIRVLSGYPAIAKRIERLRELPPDRRVALRDAYESVAHWVQTTGDEALGLKAGQLMSLGSGGALEYAMHSAQTLRESMSIARRYGTLLSDALEPTLEIDGPRAVVRLANTLPWPRSVADFTMSAWFTVHLRTQLAEAPQIECWFGYPQPHDLSPYQTAFGDAKLRFDAPFYGFVFDLEFVDRPLASANAVLHSVHCEHLKALLERRPDQVTMAMRVRQLLAHELSLGRPTAHGVAKQMNISRRTLVRRLAAEETSFSAQIDELRRQLALHLMATEDMSLHEVTKSVGFAHVQAFHRAFKRWTGKTPTEYRISIADANVPQAASSSM
ncbi:MAG TPA: AraC family transcriptional regulator ligand-binding domain-containing protein [Polyangiales bacterium]|nr:AraC family transcriptional regulator ligand-binding domain-containing protein [Polyangiales bacterium]